MKANEVSLNKFLSQPETQFVIPVYQRNYDWGVSECGQLFNDILNVGLNDSVSSHFIGSIVFIHDDIYSSSTISELSIIDGQQRLTTITLLYIAIYSYAQLVGNQSLVNKIQETYLINKFADEREKLKLKPTENNVEALQFLLRNDPNDSFVHYSRLIENFNFFISKISSANFDIIQKGIGKLIFVEISLDRSKDDPQKIFESLNSTGLELTQSDLIRNYILMGLKSKEQEKIYENYWKAIEFNAIHKGTNNNRVSDFIRDFLTIENRDIPNKDKVYLEFKKKYSFTNLENEENLKNLEEVLGKIKKYSFYYNKFINPDNEQDLELRSQLSYINKLEINVAFPFLLEVYNDFSSKLIDKQTLINIFELVQTFTWRRFIVSLPTNSLNKIFMRLYEDVNKKDYLPSLQRALLRKKSTQRFPRNDEVINILKDRDMYGIQSKNRTYLLEKLENFENKEPVLIENNTDITIEHIFPVNPDAEWKHVLGEGEYNLLKDKYLNTLANLTLSGNNGKLGNRYFTAKRDMNLDGKEQGYKFSRLWLNRYLAGLSKWDYEELQRRFELISKRFLSIWPFPDIIVDDSSQSEEVNIFDADDPTNKKLDYAIFFNQKIEVSSISVFYGQIMRSLFELSPTLFFTSNIEEKLGLRKSASECNQPIALNESNTYFIEGNLNSTLKFDRIKLVLTAMDVNDELYIKYV
ncbi:MAG TPA: DUF262 domain-containing protein [Mucilaginibacter sp.]|jgi:uncharacterized protein with ParB-like and HNH nuclease domain|nr:DUF262 domain-containing protein [Mucilaginibacter sp.]